MQIDEKDKDTLATQQEDNEKIVITAEDSAGESIAEEDSALTEEEIEQRRERRREERKRKKEARFKKDKQFEEQNLLLNGFQQALAEAHKRIADLESGRVEDKLTQVDKAVNVAEAKINQLRKVVKTAVETSDGDAFDASNDLLLKTIRDKETLEEYRKRVYEAVRGRGEEGGAQVQEPPNISSRDVRVAQNYEIFCKRNKWFDPNGRDEESKIVLAIDQAVFSDGYDPEGKDYWEEVEDRIATRLPQRRLNGKVSKDRQLITGSSSTGVNMGSRQEVYLSPARVEAMKQAGAWDDPQRRSAMIKRFQEYDKSNKRRA